MNLNSDSGRKQIFLKARVHPKPTILLFKRE